jgi:hypothetical protein
MVNKSGISWSDGVSAGARAGWELGHAREDMAASYFASFADKCR